jgi:hypothetical protein
VSARGSPAHPRAARHARGLFVRPIGALRDRSPQALVPCCRRLHDELCPSTRAILRDSRPSQTDPSAVVLIRSRPALRPRTIPQPLHATPRQATTPGPPSLRALTRVPSCATRARRALQPPPAASTGPVFAIKTGSLFSIGIRLLHQVILPIRSRLFTAQTTLTSTSSVHPSPASGRR